MSSTTKDRLALVKTSLDSLFASTTSADVEDLVKDLRDYLTLKRSAAARGTYDPKTNRAIDTEPRP